MPRDDKDYPLKSYEDEYGTGHLTYEEKLQYDEDIKRINEGGSPDDGDYDWSKW